MGKRDPRSNLEDWEARLVKAMLLRGGYEDQHILAYFTRPSRPLNHRVIKEVRDGHTHQDLAPASDDELEEFLTNWPQIDPNTGLHLIGDELLIKAREAMIAAVQTFNSAGLVFRSEIFIVTAVIAWTYLLHAYYASKGIDYRYYEKQGGKKVVARTEQGAEKYWDISRCLKDNNCPLDRITIKNLEFIIAIRDEIEHRSTSSIDDALSAKLQACCVNFNDYIKSLFGPQYRLERNLSIALQFVTFTSDQQAAVKKARRLPRNLETLVDSFHQSLSEEERADSRLAYRVAFVQKRVNRPNTADEAVEFISAETETGQEMNRVLLKEVERPKYLPTEIVDIMKTRVLIVLRSVSTRFCGKVLVPKILTNNTAFKLRSSGIGTKSG